MTTKKLHYILVGALVFVGLAIGTFLFLGKNFMETSSENVINAKLEIVKAEKKESTYIKNKKIYLENEDTAQKLAKLVPNDKQEVPALESIYAYARDASLNVVSVVFPGSNLDPNIKSKIKVDISQAVPIEGLKKVYEIPLEVTVVSPNNSAIPTGQLINFIESVERSPRSMKITSITYDPTSNDVKLKISLFVKE